MVKIEIGKLVSRTFTFYFKLFGSLFSGALIVWLPLNLVIDAMANQMQSLVLIGILSVVIALLGGALIQAYAVHAVADLEDDGTRDLGVTDLFKRAAPVLGLVVAVTFLTWLGTIVGFLLLIVPGLLAMTWWSVAIPSAVIDRPGVIGAFRRSIELVRGNAWRVFWFVVLMAVILVIGGFVVDFAINVVDIDTILGETVATSVSNAAITPFAAVGSVVLYFELRLLRDKRAERVLEGQPE